MKEKDVSIEIIRIIAMLFIVVCHLFQELNSQILNYLAQFFNIGVFIFFFISGYLYGKKEIKDIKNFYISRFKRIIVPMYVFVIIVILLNLFIRDFFKAKYIFIYLFDIQYIFGGLNGAEHLWFLTIIIICYLILPLMLRNRKFIKNIKPILLGFVSIITIYLLSIINSKLALVLVYYMTFAIGFISRNNKKEHKYLFYLFIIFISVVIRLLSRSILDGTNIYDIIIVSYTQIVISISLFNIINKFIEDKRIKRSNKLIEYIDKISFYVYITHYMFFVGPVRTIEITSNIIVNIIITLALSYISAVILKFITEMIIRFLNKNKIKEKT